MSKRTPKFIAAALIGLSSISLIACSNKGDHTAAADQPADTAKPVSTLDGAYKRCSGPQTFLEYKADYNRVGSIYRGIAMKLAKDGQTEQDVLQTLLSEMYDAKEHTLSIRGAWAEDDKYGLTEVSVLFGVFYDCVVKSLDVPERVRDHIGTTRALDGQQTDTWNDFNARWTFHPDHGVSITFWES